MADFDFAAFFADDAVFAFDGNGTSLIRKMMADSCHDTKRTNAGWFINQH